MSLEWKYYELKDIVNVNMGQSPKSKYYNENFEGCPFLQGNKTFGDKYPTFELYTTDVKKIAKRNSVIMSVRAPVGDLNIAPIDICIGRGVCSLTIKNGSNEFLYYLLKANITKLINQENGTVFGSINKKDIEMLELKIPEDIDIQNQITFIFTNIDKKIDITKKINKNLEEFCHNIFKYYFIDFIPFIENCFENSDLGEIPKGWKITNVGNILNCKLGGTPHRSNELYWGGDIAWINSGKVNEFRIIEPSEYITEEGLNNSATKLLPAKTTVIAITGATLGQISLLEIDSCANQSVIGIIPNKEYPYEFVYPLISSILFDLLKHQTGGAQQHINKNNLKSFNIICPPNDIISRYKDIVSPAYSQISNNCFEIEKLQKLRDTLLPKLMSGEIDVSKINCDLE